MQAERIKQRFKPEKNLWIILLVEKGSGNGSIQKHRQIF
jgi:hypothetical protein